MIIMGAFFYANREYLARNLKADVNIISPIVSLYRELFNRNGMDLINEISFCKNLVVDEKRLVFRG